MCSISLALLLVHGCVSRPEPLYASQQQRLRQAIVALDTKVDKKESKLLSQRILAQAARLTRRFDRTLPPWWHNLLVNLHLKNGGLCWQYADAIYLDLLRHQAILPHYRFHLVVAHRGEYFREHNAVLVVAKDKPLNKGLVIDAWRDSGRLVFYPVDKDPDYRWKHRKDRCLCGMRNEEFWRRDFSPANAIE